MSNVINTINEMMQGALYPICFIIDGQERSASATLTAIKERPNLPTMLTFTWVNSKGVETNASFTWEGYEQNQGLVRTLEDGEILERSDFVK